MGFNDGNNVGTEVGRTVGFDVGLAIAGADDGNGVNPFASLPRARNTASILP